MLAALITTAIFHGRKAARMLLFRSLSLGPLLYVFIALLSPFVLAVIAAYIDHTVNNTPVVLSGLLTVKEFPALNLFSYFAYNFIFFGMGEEMGWRGFALPLLQTRMNALASGILLTIFWAAWHWPAFLYRPGYTGMDMAGILGWLFSLLTGSILLTWLYNASRGSILVCALFHTTVDIAFTADFARHDIVNYMGMLITVWGILTVLIFRPRNLAFGERIRTPF